MGSVPESPAPMFPQKPVADRWAFLFAVEKPLDAKLGSAPYAESGMRKLSATLAEVGIPRTHQFLLLGSHATRAVVDSRLRKLRKSVRKGDEILVALAGPTEGSAFLCWDALADDLPATSLSVPEMLGELASSKASQIVFLLDGSVPDLDAEFEKAPHSAALAAAEPGEASHPATEWQASVWLHLVTEAIAGKAAKSLARDGTLTIESLQRHIERELPRQLRRHLDPGATQTPQVFAVHGDLVLSKPDRSLVAPLLLDPARMRRVAFRGESTIRFKDLAGYRKTFQIPDNSGPSTRRFVAKISHADIRADVDSLFESSREHLGYRRKDLEVTAGQDGIGTVRGPDFEYTVSAAPDADDPSEVRFRREVGTFADVEFVRSEGFAAVFGKLFDQLVFEFAVPIDVSALVDRIEDRPAKGLRVDVSADGKSCEITLAGFSGKATIDRSSLVIHGRAGHPAELLEQFLQFWKTVGPVGEAPALPAAGR